METPPPPPAVERGGRRETTGYVMLALKNWRREILASDTPIPIRNLRKNEPIHWNIHESMYTSIKAHDIKRYVGLNGIMTHDKKRYKGKIQPK